MSPLLDEQELHRRAVLGVRWEVEAFGCAAPDSRLLRYEGLIAAVVPASPQRSVFNSVQYDDAAQLAARLDELAAGGHRSASLRASRAGAPLYERLGFRDFGAVEMWELRR